MFLSDNNIVVPVLPTLFVVKDLLALLVGSGFGSYVPIVFCHAYLQFIQFVVDSINDTARYQTILLGVT